MDIEEILKKFRALAESEDECNMTAEGTYCPVHGMEECSMMREADGDEGDTDAVDATSTADDDSETPASEPFDSGDDARFDKTDQAENEDEADIKAKDDEYYDAIKAGNVPEDVVEPDRFMRYYEKKYGVRETVEVSEDVHITLNGPEADAFIHRLSVLAGQAEDNGQWSQATEVCPDCGMPEDQCACDHDDHGESCPHCGTPMDQCNCDGSHEATFGPDGVTMENADHDFGSQEHSDSGEPVDLDTYMYKAPDGPQRLVKSVMGDNPLIKEDSEKLFAKLKGDYRTYVAEAELAASNAPGANSPLTATDRDDFEKDPFADEEPVTDGSRSPLSIIKRQSVAK